MFIEPTFLSLFIAKLKGGKIRDLEKVHIKGWYLFILSALLQAVISLVKKYNIPKLNDFIGNYFIYLIGISYLLMMITVLLNIKKSYMKIFLIGIILNFIVIIGNNGQMPVSLNGLNGIKTESVLPEKEFDIKHRAVTKDTKFVYLADIILLPKPYPLPKILSIGDVFLIVGNFLFFQEEMIINKKKLEYPSVS